ncbi:MAG: tetratricopeptide repeat protein [Marinilabiliaceae bacterium]
MRSVLIAFALVAALASLSSSAAAQSERKYIRDSYKMYNDSNYAGAQEACVKALAEAPNSFEASYNYADALFKQGKVEEALEQYQKLAEGETDKARLAKLYHNIGNCEYARKGYDKSIDAYKKSLKADPSSEQTRYNLVAAQKMKDKDQQNDQKQQNKDQQQQQQEQKQQQQQQQEQQQQQQQQEQQQQMNKEEAERLLQMAQQDENELQEKRKQIKDAQRRRIEKNW